MEKLVSIIVPVYNVEKYLDKCLKSLINQSYKNIEIIIVNDGSTDGSFEICNKFYKQDKRIKLLNKKNEGISLARKSGFNECKGEYILFVDSDDYINYDYIREMFMHNDLNPDIIISKINLEYGSYSEEFSTELCESNVYFPEEILRKMLINKEVKDYAWGKLFKKELIKDEYFTESRCFEDIEFTHRVIMNAKNIVYSENSIYNYVQRENSLLSSKFDESKLQLINATETMLSNIKEKYPNLKEELEYRYIVAIFMIIIPIIKNNLNKNNKYNNYYIKYCNILKTMSINNKFLMKKDQIYMILNKINLLNAFYKIRQGSIK